LSPSSPNVGENIVHAGTEVVPEWKKELNERLAATRSRRLRNQAEQVALPGLGHLEHKEESRASRLAAKVAKRYANAPSYSELLAAEAEKANAALPKEDIYLSSQPIDEAFPLADSWDRSLDTQVTDDTAVMTGAAGSHAERAAFAASPEPEEDAPFAAVEPLAANLVEIPRELVAARKVRPRLAEGPLRETAEATEHDQSQLRIFEVAPESISQTVRIERAADWSPIRLDTAPVTLLRTEGQLRSQEIPLKTAPLEDRLMAGIFDLALVVAAFAIFILVFVACTAHPPTGKPALLVAGLVLAGFCILYQYLFFKFAEGTPGMRYAKIALCTFDDENPTRKAMCRRVWFLLLSAAPLGLGFAWAWFDPDRLGWHDRMSRIYQRSYS
jgi:uncharacterized RDD family membrane protein YckC